MKHYLLVETIQKKGFNESLILQREKNWFVEWKNFSFFLFTKFNLNILGYLSKICSLFCLE